MVCFCCRPLFLESERERETIATNRYSYPSSSTWDTNYTFSIVKEIDKRDGKILTQHKHTIVNTRWVMFVSNHLKMQNLERILLIIKPSRIFEYVPQKGLLSWSILSSSSVHELTCHGVGRASMSIPRSGRWRHNDMFPRDMRLPEHIQTTFRCIANVGGFRIMFGRFY